MDDVLMAVGALTALALALWFIAVLQDWRDRVWWRKREDEIRSRERHWDEGYRAAMEAKRERVKV